MTKIKIKNKMSNGEFNKKNKNKRRFSTSSYGSENEPLGETNITQNNRKVHTIIINETIFFPALFNKNTTKQ